MLSLVYLNRTFQMLLWSFVELFIIRRSLKIRIPWAYQLAFLVVSSLPYLWLTEFFYANQFFEFALICLLIFKFSKKVTNTWLKLFFAFYVKLGVDIIARFTLFVIVVPLFPHFAVQKLPIVSIILQVLLTLFGNEVIIRYFKMDFLRVNEVVEDKSIQSVILFHNIFFLAYFLVLWLTYVLVTPFGLINATEAANFRINTSTLFMLVFLSFISMLNFKVATIYEERLVSQKESELKNITDYSHQIENLYAKIRSFRHDYSNILTSLRYSADHDDLASVRQTLDEITWESDQILGTKEFEIANLANLKDDALKSIFSSKLSKAIDLGLDIKVEILNPIGLPVSFSSLDFIRLVSNLLDNAIEAANESEDEQLLISYFKHDDTYVFILANSTKEKTDNIAQLFQTGVSSKGKDRGVGLAIVKKILSTYPNVRLNTSNQNGLFTQHLEVQE